MKRSRTAERFAEHFGHKPEVCAFAPGRIEFIGNHTDYNGGCVLGASVNLGINVAIASRNDGRIHLVSEAMKKKIKVSASHIEPLQGKAKWANYPLGVAKIMAGEGFPLAGGFSFLAVNDLPIGCGLSSSAALELSTAYAIARLNGYQIDRKHMAAMCRRAENEFVGVPCGILDQGVSAFGGREHLVHIDCFTETFSQEPIPDDCEFWIFNTNREHALVDSKYAERHRECRQAFEILKNEHPEAACLAHIPPSTVQREQDKLGPVLYKRALHVTEENLRVERVVQALQKRDLKMVGRMLTASHYSSRDLFENSCPELDFLVDCIALIPGIYGARLTGGGFGGAVMAFAAKANGLAGKKSEIEELYHTKFGLHLSVHHTQPGEGAKASC